MKGLCFLAFLALAGAELPENYEYLSAGEKQAILWRNIKTDAYTPDTLAWNYDTGSRMNIYNDTRIVYPHFLKNVFLTLGDELNPGVPKLLMPFGVAFKSELIIKPNSPFTGIFKTGGIGVMRLSANPGPRPTPMGMAIKVLIDGKPSQNIFSHVDSGEDKISSHFAREVGSFAQAVGETPLDRKIGDAFMNTTFILPGTDPKDRPISNLMLGLVEQSSVENNGNIVTDNIIAPYLIKFVPSGIVNGTFRRGTDDFRKVLLKNIKPNVMLFTVKAQMIPECGDMVTIGELWSRSRAVASFYEDQQLLFRHPRRQWDETFALTDTCDSMIQREKYDEPLVTPPPYNSELAPSSIEETRDTLARYYR